MKDNWMQFKNVLVNLIGLDRIIIHKKRLTIMFIEERDPFIYNFNDDTDRFIVLNKLSEKLDCEIVDNY